jgi:O-antigen ligase
MVTPLAVALAVKGVGAVIAALAAGGALALPSARARALSALLALALTPALLVGELWDSPQVQNLRDRPSLAAAAVVGGALVVAAFAAAIHRYPLLLPILAVGALPFRVPFESGGESANLLVPLYLVVAGGVVALAWERLGPPAWRAAGDAGGNGSPDARPWADDRRAGPVELALIASVVLYAVQSLYSSDFEQALKNIAFFYVPFMLLLKLLVTVRWTPRVVVGSFGVAVLMALVFAGIGFVEYATGHLLWNQKVIESNLFEEYFRVNSLFFDPNIYGRFLAIVMIGLGASLLWPRRVREVALATAAVVVLWAGLILTFSQSSIAALLVGLGVLAALRWGWRRVGVAAGAVVAVGLAVVLIAPGLLKLDLGSTKSLDRATSGRLDLMGGGLALFADRPLFGYGSGSFAERFREREGTSSREAATASHTIPITIAAEQGVPGLAVYVALLIAVFGLLFRGLAPLGGRAPPRRLISRAYLAAAFTGLFVHTLLYAAFLEDPITWTLLAAGIVLGRRVVPKAAVSSAASAVPSAERRQPRSST